ncbi:MAG: OadG family protein [Tissierella sp.]|nr:OadG family protein [Tissierella sp.]
MGEQISLLDALLVTLVSMVAVFVILILISSLINGLRMISGDKKKTEEAVAEVKPAKNTVEIVPVPEVVKEDNEELVAVIASVVAMHLGLNIPDINIKSIKRVQQNSNPWSSTSKAEQLRGRLY